jgi:hypothetical protein
VSLDPLLRRQAGVLTLQQAVELGVSRQTVARRAREGDWRRLHPGVYLVGGHRLTDEARVRAAWLWGGDDSVVSGPAAAYWHDLLGRAVAELRATLATAA